jgi:hypothetical protein
MKVPLGTNLRLVSAAPCAKCGTPTTNLGGVCIACLNGDWLRGEWERARAILRARPEVEIVLARDAGLVQHLVLFGAAGVAWCGERTTEKLARRRQAPAGRFPAGVCARCLQKFEELHADAEKT